MPAFHGHAEEIPSMGQAQQGHAPVLLGQAWLRRRIQLQNPKQSLVMAGSDLYAAQPFPARSTPNQLLLPPPLPACKSGTLLFSRGNLQLWNFPPTEPIRDFKGSWLGLHVPGRSHHCQNKNGNYLFSNYTIAAKVTMDFPRHRRHEYCRL